MIGHRHPARTLLVGGIRGYQTLISPALPRSCKYHPSCSQYAIDALTEFGLVRGLVLSLWRLVRCNPLSYGGYDPVDRQTLFTPRNAPRNATGHLLEDSPHESSGGSRGDANAPFGRSIWTLARNRGPRRDLTGTA